MPFRFGAEEWAHALEARINASSEYRNAGAAWGVGFDGTLLFCFERDARLPETLRLLLRLERGACRDAKFVTETEAAGAGFVLRAPFSLWKEILEGKSLAATAILTGKMRVEGDKLLLLKHVGAHRALIHCAASVETEFPAP